MRKIFTLIALKNVDVVDDIGDSVVLSERMMGL